MNRAQLIRLNKIHDRLEGAEDKIKDFAKVDIGSNTNPLKLTAGNFSIEIPSDLVLSILETVKNSLDTIVTTTAKELEDE